MRNDYTGYGLLKDCAKWAREILDILIIPGMDMEQKTLIRIQVANMNHKELALKLKEVRTSKNQS